MTTNELLLNCISAFLKGEKLIASDETDWQELIQKAEQQKILPMVYEVLGAAMPADIYKKCKAAVIQTVAGQTRRTAEFLDVYKELKAAGLEPVVVKGIVCRNIYSKPDYRVSFDEDLYIPREKYEAFHKKMLIMGFEAKEPDYDNSHEMRYNRNGFIIEGHWELFPQTNDALKALNKYTEGIPERIIVQYIDGVPLNTPEPTDHMIFLLLHAYKHFINSGVGVRQLCDIAQWSACHELEWDRIRELMKCIHGECFASAVFDAGEKYFGMTFPENWERADCEALLKDALAGGVYGSSDMNRKHSATITEGAVESARGKTKDIPLIKTLFPNRKVMEISYPWLKKSGVLLPFAWSARIVKYIFSHEQDNSAAESVRIGFERLELLKQYKII